MTIDFDCPNCSAPIRAPEEFEGRFGTCNKCGQRTQIPRRRKQVSNAERVEAISMEFAEIVADSGKPIVDASANQNLIECPDCRQKISKRASCCPHCGAPNEIADERDAAGPTNNTPGVPPPPPNHSPPSRSNVKSERELASGVVGIVGGILLFFAGCLALDNARTKEFLGFLSDGMSADQLRTLGWGCLVIGVTTGGSGLYRVLKQLNSKHQ